MVPDDQLSLAIGRRGQNVRLATQLTEWEIDILTQKEESEKRQLEFTNKTGNIVSVLDVDETLAQLMISEGFETVYDFATSPLSDLSAVDGIDEDMALELQTRAKEYLQKQEELMDKKIQDLNIDKDIRFISNHIQDDSHKSRLGTKISYLINATKKILLDNSSETIFIFDNLEVNSK